MVFPARGDCCSLFLRLLRSAGLLKEREAMTVKECYSQMGGDYNNVLSRFYDEAMVKRLLGKFVSDTSFDVLEQAMAEGDVKAAFGAAHTLRGACQSLSFTSLCGTLDSITEALRRGDIAAAAADMDKAKHAYDTTLCAIRACTEE